MKKYFLFIIGIFISSTCLAINDTDYNIELLNKIAANETFCVEKLEEGKLYLKSDRILPTNYGIFLNLNDTDFVLIDKINSDNNGCYVGLIQVLNTCRFCGKEYFVVCRNPECPRNKK